MKYILTGLLVLAYFAPGTHGDCPATAYLGDGSYYPKKPMTFQELDDVVIGRTGKSRPLYEVYSLHSLDFPPALRRVVINWQKLPNGTYKNDITGSIAGTTDCYGVPLLLDQDSRSKAFKYVRFGFNIFLPEPVYHIGTMYSSCPERYIISWHCQADMLVGSKCLGGTRMSILTFSDNIDHLPWHEITADICKNHSPRMDEIRWKFTFEGFQCLGDVLPDPSARKKRDIKMKTRHDLDGVDLWP